MRFFALWATVACTLLVGTFFVASVIEALSAGGALGQEALIGFGAVTIALSGTITSTIVQIKEI